MCRLKYLDTEPEQTVLRYIVDIGNVFDTQSPNLQNFKAFLLKKYLQSVIYLVIVCSGDRQPLGTEALESLDHRGTHRHRRTAARRAQALCKFTIEGRALVEAERGAHQHDCLSALLAQGLRGRHDS